MASSSAVEAVGLRFLEFLAGGKAGSSSSSGVVVVVVVVDLRFLEFLGANTTVGVTEGDSFFATRLLAALSRLDRRVAIVRSEGWRMVRWRTRCITLEVRCGGVFT